jgi:glycosyltransferase involved in cell wall biosynthesis
MLTQLGRYDALHCSSEHMAQTLAGHGVDRESMRVIPITSCLPESIRPVTPPEGPLTFGFVTGASVSKGVHVLLDAFARLPAGKARLIAHGFEDPLAWGARYPLPGVSFRPPYDPYAQINEVLGELHVGVVPSVFAEPFGLAGLEFHAAHLPVIASDTGGIPEWLTSGSNGLLVPPGDPGALALAMARLIDEPETVARLRSQIRPWKTMRQHALEILELYEDTLAIRRGQRESER